jgi:hypothetical protein
MTDARTLYDEDFMFCPNCLNIEVDGLAKL